MADLGGIAVDFREISSGDGFEFERFTEDILRSLGWTIIKGAGAGPDGGRDILASIIETTATGRQFTRVYVVQCKHFAGSGNSVGAGDLGQFALMPEKHEATGWLLVTSTRLTADAVNTVDAARSAGRGNEYDYWDAQRLRAELSKEACRAVLRQYLPTSYARAAGILTLSRNDLARVVIEWRTRDARWARFFADATDDDSYLVAFAASNNVTIAEITALMQDDDLGNEFLSMWERQCARGEVQAPPVLMLNGARRLQRLRLRGIPADRRELIVAGEILTSVSHRALLRRYWKDLVVYRGVSDDWTNVNIDSSNAYVPPIAIGGMRVALFCEAADTAAAGTLRVPGGAELNFIASYQLESMLQLVGVLQAPISLQLRTLPGSDAVSLVAIAFLDVGVNQWNQLV